MHQAPTYSLHPAGPEKFVISLHGDWTMQAQVPSLDELLASVSPQATALTFETSNLGAWDTRLLLFAHELAASLAGRKIQLDVTGLPAGAQRLLNLSRTSSNAEKTVKKRGPSFVSRVGQWSLGLSGRFRGLAAFIGEIILESLRFFTGKSPFRLRDFFYFVQACGAESLPIVSLISVLVGVILSFVGAIQLQMFGAQIYVANLVGLGMVLEMGALMSGIIIAGRIGAAYAAQLGTMQANEEIDALRTMGISPIGFLVLPRMYALILMMPLLCIYADIMGIFGGSIIGVTMLDLSLIEYFNQTKKVITLNHCFQGLSKSAVFGVLIGFAGCLRGIQCGRSALAVGEATTSAVVTSIVLIVVSDSIITVIINLF